MISAATTSFPSERTVSDQSAPDLATIRDNLVKTSHKRGFAKRLERPRDFVSHIKKTAKTESIH